jgi:NAD(P)H-flavin reductase
MTRTATIERVSSEAPGVNTYDLRIEDQDGAERWSFAPGQFNMLYFPGIGEAAISISGQTEDGLLRHTIRTVGSVTGALQRGGVGLSIGIRGPFGRPWPVDLFQAGSTPTNVILVAGGIGIAPLRSVVHHLIQHRDQVGQVDVLFGARTPQDLIYADEFSQWRKNFIGVHTTVDRVASDWNGHIGVVTLLLERLPITAPESTLLMTCGPEVMMRFVVQAAANRGIPESNVWVTLERNMNCAIGLCGHCQLGSAFLCKDGPVFRYDQIAPWLHIQGI